MQILTLGLLRTCSYSNENNRNSMLKKFLLLVIRWHVSMFISLIINLFYLSRSVIIIATTKVFIHFTTTVKYLQLFPQIANSRIRTSWSKIKYCNSHDDECSNSCLSWRERYLVMQQTNAWNAAKIDQYISIIITRQPKSQLWWFIFIHGPIILRFQPNMLNPLTINGICSNWIFPPQLVSLVRADDRPPQKYF